MLGCIPTFRLAETGGPVNRSKICRKRDCERSVYARALCKSHYEQRRIAARSGSRRRQRRPNRLKICRKRSCDRPIYARAWCKRHYDQHRIASRPVGWCNATRHRKRRPLDPGGRCWGCATTQNFNKTRARVLTELFGPTRGAPAKLAALRKHLQQRPATSVLRALKALEPPMRRYLATLLSGEPLTWESLQPLRIYPGGQWLTSACLRAGIVTPPRFDIGRVERELRRMERLDRRHGW